MAALLLLAASLGGAQAQTKVKVAEVVRSQLFIPLYLAMSRGFVKEQGLDLELVTAGGGDKVGALILSGGADIGLAGPEVPVYLYNGENPDKPVMFASINATDGFFLLSRKKIDNFQWSALHGQKIIGWRPGSTPQLFLEYVMKQKGVDAETVKSVITNIGIPARDGAWISGNGDFGIFNEPSTSKITQATESHVVTSMGKELGRVENTVLFAKKSWFAQNGEAAQKLTNAIAKAEKAMKTMADQDIANAVASYFPGLPPEVNVAVIKHYRSVQAPVFSETPVIDKGGLDKLQEVMVVGGTLPKDKVVPYDAIVDRKMAEKAQ
jgi:NitT/TauT family transport system substrate-binding protein